MIGVGLSLPQVAVRRVAAAASGPTVILNAAYRTDTLLDQGLVPITNGGELDSWAMATGGTFNYETAFLAGASARPIWLLGTPGPGGVHTAGNNAALTCATPVTIPADTDCVIYLKCVLAGYGDVHLGNSTSQTFLVFGGGGAGAAIQSSTGGVVSLYGEPTDATFLMRARRVSNVWRFAWTGQADTINGGDTVAGAALSFDTILGSGAGSGLSTFSTTGNYVQKIYIYHGSSSPDTAYETANGGTL